MFQGINKEPAHLVSQTMDQSSACRSQDLRYTQICKRLRYRIYSLCVIFPDLGDKSPYRWQYICSPDIMVDKLSKELVDNVLSTINLRQTEIWLLKKSNLGNFVYFLQTQKQSNFQQLQTSGLVWSLLCIWSRNLVFRLVLFDRQCLHRCLKLMLMPKESLRGNRKIVFQNEFQGWFLVPIHTRSIILSIIVYSFW